MPYTYNMTHNTYDLPPDTQHMTDTITYNTTHNAYYRAPTT